MIWKWGLNVLSNQTSRTALSNEVLKYFNGAISGQSGILTPEQFKGKIKIIANGSEAETPLATHPGIKNRLDDV